MANQHQGGSFGRLILLVVIVIVLLPVFMMALALPFMGMMGIWGPGGHMGGAVAPFWGLVSILLVPLLLIIGAYLVYRVFLRDHDPALDELRMAYARGDITDEEYERRLERLRENG